MLTTPFTELVQTAFAVSSSRWTSDRGAQLHQVRPALEHPGRCSDPSSIAPHSGHTRPAQQAGSPPRSTGSGACVLSTRSTARSPRRTGHCRPAVPRVPSRVGSPAPLLGRVRLARAAHWPSKTEGDRRGHGFAPRCRGRGGEIDADQQEGCAHSTPDLYAPFAGWRGARLGRRVSTRGAYRVGRSVLLGFAPRAVARKGGDVVRAGHGRTRARRPSRPRGLGGSQLSPAALCLAYVRGFGINLRQLRHPYRVAPALQSPLDQVTDSSPSLPTEWRQRRGTGPSSCSLCTPMS